MARAWIRNARKNVRIITIMYSSANNNRYVTVTRSVLLKVFRSYRWSSPGSTTSPVVGRRIVVVVSEIRIFFVPFFRVQALYTRQNAAGEYDTTAGGKNAFEFSLYARDPVGRLSIRAACFYLSFFTCAKSGQGFCNPRLYGCTSRAPTKVFRTNYSNHAVEFLRPWCD